MDVNLGRFILAAYALFLAVGGLAGSVKAGSRKSLLAGLGSAMACLLFLAASFAWPRWAFVAALILAVILAGFFAYRMRRTGKWMPAGMLAGISIVFAALFGVVASNSGAPQAKSFVEVTTNTGN